MVKRFIFNSKDVLFMMIYKNDGKKGFAVSTNLVSREKLGAAGLTAAIFAFMLLITKNDKKSKSKKVKPQKPQRKSKKSKSKGLIRLMFIPAIMKAAKFAVTQGKLQSLVSKVKSGEGININAFKDAPSEEEASKDNATVNVCGLEIIEPIDITGEEEVYEHI